MRYTILFLFVLCSCHVTNLEERISGDIFPREISLSAEKIPIREILNPVGMTFLEDFAIIQGERQKDKDQFYVYSREEMRFLYSMGKSGQGPNEFIAPRLIENSPGNQLSIFDSATDKISMYQLSEKGFSLGKEIKIIKNYYPTQEFSFVNDSLLIYRIVSNEGSALCCYSLAGNTITDSLVFETGLKKEYGNLYNYQLDGFLFANRGNRFVVVFPYMNEMKTGMINSEGQFNVDGGSHVENALAISFNAKKLNSNIAYYLFPSVSDDFIYAQYYGFPMISMAPFPINRNGRILSFYIDMFDYQLNPIVRVTLDNEILKTFIDKKRNKIYTWHPLKDFEHLLVYTIPDKGFNDF